MLLEVLFIPPLVTILIGLWDIASSLKEDWWQGIAGIAQIMAGILAAYTIWQARKMISQADEQRRFSVRPEWEKSRETPKMNMLWAAEPNLRRIEIRLRNSGWGPARKPRASFEPQNNNKPHQLDYMGYGGEGLPPSAVFPEQHFQINISWYSDKPLDGLLTVTYESRLEEGLQRRFHLRTWSDGVRTCYTLNDLKRADQRRRWRWPWYGNAS